MNGCRNNYFSRQSELYTWIFGGGWKQRMCQQYNSLRKDNTWRWIDMRSYTPAKHCVHIVCKLVDSREVLTFTSHSGKGGKSSYFHRSYTGIFRRNFRQATLINEKVMLASRFFYQLKLVLWCEGSARFYVLFHLSNFFRHLILYFLHWSPLWAEIFVRNPIHSFR